MIEKSRLRVKNYLRAFFGLSLIELLGVVIYFFALPRDAKNATLTGGMTYIHFGILVTSLLAFLVMLIVFLVYDLRVTRTDKHFSRFAVWLSSDTVLSLAAILVLNIVLSGYLIARWLGFAWIAPDMQARVRPFLAGWLLVSVQLLVVLLMSRRAVRVYEDNVGWVENFTARAWPIFRGMLLFIFKLFVLSLMGQYLRFFTSYREMLDFAIHEFHFHGQNNFPTYYSMALAAVAVLQMIFLGIRSIVRRERFVFHWMLMAAIFIFLAFEETLELHKQLGEAIREQVQIDLTGYLNFAWYLPVILGLILLLLVYLPFLRDLSPRQRARIILGGLVFLVGTIGMESLGSRLISDGLITFFQFVMLANVIELVKLIGISIYAAVLMQIIHDKIESVRNQAIITRRVEDLSRL